MKRTPAAVRLAIPMSLTRAPQNAEAGWKMNPAKWTAIRTHPISQWREVEVGPRRATDANAHVSAAMAARSGNLLQFTTKTPERTSMVTPILVAFQIWTDACNPFVVWRTGFTPNLRNLAHIGK